MNNSSPFGVYPLVPSVVIGNVPCSLTAAASTTVYTVPAGRRFKLTALVLHDPTADVGTAGTVNVGHNATAASYLSAQALTKLGTAAGATQMVIAGGWANGAPVLNAGDTLKVAPQTAVAGAVVQCDVIGYLE